MVVCLALLTGMFLRLKDVGRQILMDDEWHSLSYAIDYSFKELWTHMGVGATCIPLNLFHKLLLLTVGWNEWGIRALSISGGLLCLCLFPRMVRVFLNERTTVLFTVLLALSPYLVFTSRYSRPYSLYLFFAFWAFVGFCRWITTQRPVHAIIYIVAGALAIWIHLFAVIIIVVPPSYILVKGWLNPGEMKGASVRIIWTVLLCILLASALLLPSMIHSSGAFFGSRPRMDPLTYESLTGVLKMVTGSVRTPVVVLFLGLVLLGGFWMIRSEHVFGGLFAATTLGYLAAIEIVAPPKMNVPLQIARYGVFLFPMAFICVAVALDRIWSWMKFRGGGGFYGMTVAMGIGLFLAGPLPELYRTTNNFTNHAAYQESYGSPGWDRPYQSAIFSYMTLEKERIPKFYQTLEQQADDPILVEYPLLVGFHFNIYYFYQHFHGKRVIAGYVSNLDMHSIGEPGDVVYGNTPFDFVLSKVPDKTKLGFTSMVDITRREALERTGARYVVLHRNLLDEEIGREHPEQAYLPAVALEKEFRVTFGTPLFQDSWITVFEISKARAIPR